MSRHGTPSHEHVWERVYPRVCVVGDPFAVEKGGETYNSICECGAKAWLHWPEPTRIAAPR